MTPPFPLFVLLTCRKQPVILLQLFEFNEPNSFNQGNVYKVNDCILIESIKRFFNKLLVYQDNIFKIRIS